MTEKHPDAPWRNFYGRLKGKPLRPSQKGYLEEDLAGLSPGPVTWEDNPGRTPLDLQSLFGARPLWLEVGFGGGEHMVHQAEAHPEVGIIGCEPYINGVAMLLGQLRAACVDNSRIHPGDVRDLLDVLPDASGTPAFVLSAAPWPSHKPPPPRSVTPPSPRAPARVTAPGAELRLATDIADYVRQALEEVPRAGFEWLAESAGDWRRPWPDWISTRYEQKALREGRVPHYLTFRRA